LEDEWPPATVAVDRVERPCLAGGSAGQAAEVDDVDDLRAQDLDELYDFDGGGALPCKCRER
jgi:hypothetical protein